MSSSELLNSLGPKLLSGEIEVVDCTGDTWSKHTNLTIASRFCQTYSKSRNTQDF